MIWVLDNGSFNFGFKKLRPSSKVLILSEFLFQFLKIPPPPRTFYELSLYGFGKSKEKSFENNVSYSSKLKTKLKKLSLLKALQLRTS